MSRLQVQMDRETDSLRSLTSAIASQQYTKEGIATGSLIQQWLDAVLLSTKSEAEMEVVNEWKQSLDDRYVRYAPVGSTLKRKNRLISFTEQSYLAMLQALNTARLRQKNLQMTSATLKIINPPVLPISAEPTKRKMMVIAAFFVTAVFILVSSSGPSRVRDASASGASPGSTGRSPHASWATPCSTISIPGSGPTC